MLTALRSLPFSIVRLHAFTILLLPLGIVSLAVMDSLCRAHPIAFPAHSSAARPMARIFVGELMAVFAMSLEWYGYGASWKRKGGFRGQTTPDALNELMVSNGEPGILYPVTHCFNVPECGDTNAGRSISYLGSACRPANVSTFIVTFPIWIAIKRVIQRWARANRVSDVVTKYLERIAPARANGYSSGSVSDERMVLRVVASGHHSIPDRVKGMLRACHASPPCDIQLVSGGSHDWSAWLSARENLSPYQLYIGAAA